MIGTENRENRREDLLEELFRHADARERPPAADEQAVRASLHAQWENMTQRRRRTRRLSLAAAALVFIGVFSAVILNRQPAALIPSVQVATIERVTGNVSLQVEGGSTASALSSGQTLKSGQLISTAYGSGLTLRWESGVLLRLDQNSRLELKTPQLIEMEGGRIYIDTADSGESVLDVETPAGPVRHVGTRYMVDVNLGTTRVSVREGRISIGQDSSYTSAGERLVVDMAGKSRRESIPLHGDLWSWADQLAPPFEADGRSIGEFLDWVSRESGLTLEYASEDARRMAQDSRLLGTVERAPMEALELVMQTTDLVYEVNDGVISVSTTGEH